MLAAMRIFFPTSTVVAFQFQNDKLLYPQHMRKANFVPPPFPKQQQNFFFCWTLRNFCEWPHIVIPAAHHHCCSCVLKIFVSTQNILGKKDDDKSVMIHFFCCCCVAGNAANKTSRVKGRKERDDNFHVIIDAQSLCVWFVECTLCVSVLIPDTAVHQCETFLQQWLVLIESRDISTYHSCFKFTFQFDFNWVKFKTIMTRLSSHQLC